MSKYKNTYRIESARLKGWDYSTPSLYFITINTKDHIHYFGTVVNSKTELNDMGKIAEKCWKDIPIHLPYVQLDNFIVMPSHIHGIIFIENHKNISFRRDVACNVSTVNLENGNKMGAISPHQGSLSSIIRSYKSAVSKAVHEIGIPEFAWQTRFYDRIIRDYAELYFIRNYIEQNPANWRF